MNKYYFIVIFLILITISVVIGSFFVIPSEKIETKISIIDYQEEIENNFNAYGYTINNPNIIINPYNISPLTALIIFETNDYVTPKVEIIGKTIDTTFTYTLNENKIHYIPIYFLYPNYDNKIIISYNNIRKEIIIPIENIDNEFIIDNEVENDLLFVNNNKYMYAYDKNKDIRWYINNNYQGNISLIENNHLIVGSNKLTENNKSISIVEIDLLGKIYYEYILDKEYENINYIENNKILINNNKEINRQNGIINTNNYISKDIIYDYKINTNIYYQLNKGIIFNNLNITTLSKEKINLYKVKKIDQEYDKYKVNIYKDNNRLVLNINKEKEDQIYLILDKFFDKRIYKIDSNIKYINNTDLSGKYSLYLKINNTIYKLNKYVEF